MKPTEDRLIMPVDVELAPVAEIDRRLLVDLQFAEGDWIATRVGSRSRSIIISTDLAELIQAFRTPCTILEVIVHYARVHGLDPQDVLDESWPLLTRLLKANWLVPEDSDLRRSLEPWFKPGDLLAGYTTEACIHITEDTQVYRARTPAGLRCAVKVVDAASGGHVSALDHEAQVLERLSGSPSPRFFDLGSDDRHRFLAMEWCDGVEVTQALASSGGSQTETRDLLIAILSSYASLHDRGVIHGDVHPGNLLVDAKGNIKILDFGLARMLDDPASGARRGGAPEYFDPDYAAAAIVGAPLPPATALSEQYALGALCYRVASNRDYLLFSPEAHRFYQQVMQAAPLSFAENGVAPWPELEGVLSRSLAKSAIARFKSVKVMADAVSRVRIHDQDAPGSAPVTATYADRLIKRLGELVDPNNDLFTAGPGTGPRATFMNGAAGIAYYLLRVAELTGDPTALATADQWAERASMLAREPRGVYDESVAVGREVIGTVSPYHTTSGVELVRALVANARGDTRTLLEATRAYLDLASQPHHGVDPTLGVTSVLAGYSHLARSLREVGDQEAVTAPLLARLTDHANAVASHVTQRAVRQRREDSLLITHTGAAHGWAGVLYALLTWSDVTNRDVDDAVAERLGELAGRGLRQGRGLRWPMRIDEQPPSFMNSWCHGSPGHVYLWNAAYRALGVTAHRDIGAAAAIATVEDYGPNTTLCCGQAGHVFALLNMFRHTQDQMWLRFATERLHGALIQNDAVSAGPWSHSLYRGEVGLALAAVEIAYPEEARHPLFE
jgi:serine/threonine-protein kinase